MSDWAVIVIKPAPVFKTVSPLIIILPAVEVKVTSTPDVVILESSVNSKCPADWIVITPVCVDISLLKVKVPVPLVWTLIVLLPVDFSTVSKIVLPPAFKVKLEVKLFWIKLVIVIAPVSWIIISPFAINSKVFASILFAPLVPAVIVPATADKTTFVELLIFPIFILPVLASIEMFFAVPKIEPIVILLSAMIFILPPNIVMVSIFKLPVWMIVKSPALVNVAVIVPTLDTKDKFPPADKVKVLEVILPPRVIPPDAVKLISPVPTLPTFISDTTTKSLP